MLGLMDISLQDNKKNDEILNLLALSLKRELDFLEFRKTLHCVVHQIDS